MANMPSVSMDKLLQEYNSLLRKNPNLSCFKRRSVPCEQSSQSVEAKMVPVVQSEKRPRSFGAGDPDSGNSYISMPIALVSTALVFI